MIDPDLYELVAGAAVLLTVAGAAVAGGDDVVATSDVPKAAGSTEILVSAGEVVPQALLDDAATKALLTGKTRVQKRSRLGAILAGKDNRTSTSKTVAFAWTLAIAWGLLAIVLAKVFGDPGPFDQQNRNGLQEEYLLLLGGPFAAAVLAKYAATSQQATKTTAAVGSANAAQLVSGDNGDTDLGDFQYVLFNAIGLVFFFGSMIGHLAKGFPQLPDLLTGLMLTSVAGYTAKKVALKEVPTLISVVPSSAEPGAEVHVFGTNLVLAVALASRGTPVDPIVVVGPWDATVKTHDLVLGNDRLTVVVPQEATPGSAPISATRGDGAPATAPGGIDVLPFTVLTKKARDPAAAEPTRLVKRPSV